MKLPCEECICRPSCQNSKMISPLVEKCSIIASYIINYKTALNAINFFKPGYYEFLCNNPRDLLIKENILKIIDLAKRVRNEKVPM